MDKIEYTSMAEEAEEAEEEETIAEKYGLKSLPKLDDIEKAYYIREKRDKEKEKNDTNKENIKKINYVHKTFPKLFENALIQMNKEGHTYVEIKIKPTIYISYQQYEIIAQNILDDIYKNNSKHRMVIRYKYGMSDGSRIYHLYIVRKSIFNLWGRIV